MSPLSAPARRRWPRAVGAVVVLALVLATSAAAMLPQQTGNVDLLSEADVRLDGAVGGDALGLSVAAPSANNGRANSGSAYLVFGFGAPAVSYPSPVAGTAGQPLGPVVPEVIRTGLASFAVSPSLPPRLTLDAATGPIAGIPVAPSDSTHTVTMTDLTGSAGVSVRVVIGSGPAPPATPPDVITTSPRRPDRPGRQRPPGRRPGQRPPGGWPG